MKVLIVRLSSLGDVIHNMPMVADILRHHPAAQIDWVVEEAYSELIALNTGARRVIPFALRRWRKHLGKRATWKEIGDFRRHLKTEQYDYVFDTQGLLKSGLVMGMACLKSGGKKIGMANGTEGCSYESANRWFHDHSVPVPPRAHAVLRARLVAADGLNYEVDGNANFMLRSPSIAPPSWLPAEPYAVFFHATARQSKQWPVEHWIDTATYIAQRGMPVLLPWGSQAEHDAAKAMAAHMSNAIVLPRLSMLEAVLLAQRADLVIGVDTGLTHIAAAYCRPTIELYCDSPRWNTEGNWSPTIINLGERGCAPGTKEVRSAIDYLLPKNE